MSDDLEGVLVIDSDISFRAMCGQIVASLGYEVVEVGETHVALDLIRSRPQQVIIVDWTCLASPQDVAIDELLTAQKSDRPELLITCEAEHEDLAIAVGMGSVLIKPIAPNQLVQAVNEALESATARVSSPDATAPKEESRRLKPSEPPPEALALAPESGQEMFTPATKADDDEIVDAPPPTDKPLALTPESGQEMFTPTAKDEDEIIDAPPQPDEDEIIDAPPQPDEPLALAPESGQEMFTPATKADDDEIVDAPPPLDTPVPSPAPGMEMFTPATADDVVAAFSELDDNSHEPNDTVEVLVDLHESTDASEGTDVDQLMSSETTDVSSARALIAADESTSELSEDTDVPLAPPNETHNDGPEGISSTEFIITSGFVADEEASINSEPSAEQSQAARKASRHPTHTPSAARGPIIRIPSEPTPDPSGSSGGRTPSTTPSSMPGASSAPMSFDPPKGGAVSGHLSSVPQSPLHSPSETEQAVDAPMVAPGLPSSGSLAKDPFVKLAVATAREKTTGTLSVTRHRLRMDFFFNAGKPVGVHIDNPAGGLIPWLFERDIIDGEAGDAALEEALESGADHSEVIFKRQILDPGTLVKLMGNHFAEAFRGAVGWDDGTFKFSEGKPPLKGPPLSGINFPKLVVNGVVEHALAGHLINLVEMPIQAVPVPVEGSPIEAHDIPLPTKESRVRNLILKGASIREIADCESMPPPEALAMVRAFYLLGTIDIDPTGKAGTIQRVARPPEPTPLPPTMTRSTPPPPRPSTTPVPKPADQPRPKESVSPSAPPPVSASHIVSKRQNVGDYLDRDGDIDINHEMRGILKGYVAQEKRSRKIKQAKTGLLGRLLDYDDEIARKGDMKEFLKDYVKEGQVSPESIKSSGLLKGLFKK